MNKVIRKIKLELNHIFLSLRALLISSKKECIQNLYLATVQKTGSQWIKSVLSDPEITKHTKLLSYPQRRYEWTEFQTNFPKYTLIPGLYISYGHFEEIIKPKNYRVIYIIRDPRDIIVSWYHSMKSSHVLMGKVSHHRNNLKKLNDDEGLIYCIKEFYLKLAYMYSWIIHKEDKNLLIIKFEDLVNKPQEGIHQVLEYINVSIPKEKLNKILLKYSKDEMRKNDLSKRKKQEISHYRKKSSNHRDMFKEHHYELFYSLTGGLVEALGYEK